MHSVLFAEDDSLIADAIVRQAQAEGLRVRWVRNGRAAVEATEFNQFDALVFDLKMPLLGGLEALHILRQDRRYAATPAILATADRFQSTVSEAQRLGVFSYIIKPLRVDVLIYRIHAALKPRPNDIGADTVYI